MNKALWGLVILSMMIASSAVAAPAGYLTDTVTLPGPPDSPATESGVYAVDSTNRLYFGHASGTKSEMDVRSGRGSSSEIWTCSISTGTYMNFYQSPAVNPGELGMNSVVAIWIDETTTPPTFYLADNEPVKGDYSTTGAIWIAQDINQDGDIMDPGTDIVEIYTLEYGSAMTPSLIANIADIIRNDGTGEIFVTNAEGTLGNPMVYRVFDADSSGYIEDGEIAAYYNLENDFAFAGGLTFGATKDVIYTHETTGNIYRLEDINGDNDVIGDAGEAVVFAMLPIAGALDIDMDPDGDLFVTATDWGTFAHGLYEVTTEATPVVTLFEDLSAAIGSTGTIVFGNGADFEPYQPAAGATLYMNYTTTGWADPGDFITYYGETTGPVETPALGTVGIILLIASVGLLMFRRR